MITFFVVSLPSRSQSQAVSSLAVTTTGLAMSGIRSRASVLVFSLATRTVLVAWVSVQTVWHFALVVGTALSGYVTSVTKIRSASSDY